MRTRDVKIVSDRLVQLSEGCLCLNLTVGKAEFSSHEWNYTTNMNFVSSVGISIGLGPSRSASTKGS